MPNGMKMLEEATLGMMLEAMLGTMLKATLATLSMVLSQAKTETR
jgi:hypothetical protein